MKNLKFKSKLNCVFIHIPKTAGVTIYDHILELDKKFGWFLGSEFDENEDKSLHKFNNYGSVILGHIFYKALIENNYLDKSFFKKSFKFCFVRNPYDRLVSLYWYHRIQKNLKLDFDDFVKILYKEYKNKTIPPVGLYNIKTFNKDSLLYHKKVFGNQYNPMVKWIPKDIGFIGRFENLEKDINELIKILGYKGPYISIPKTNTNRWDEDYMIYYKNKETIKYVSRIYKNDLARFGYAPIL